MFATSIGKQRSKVPESKTERAEPRDNILFKCSVRPNHKLVFVSARFPRTKIASNKLAQNDFVLNQQVLRIIKAMHILEA